MDIRANKVILKSSAGTDAVSISSDKMTTTSLPECSATVSSANQLVNKAFVDASFVNLTSNQTIAGVKTFSSAINAGKDTNATSFLGRAAVWYATDSDVATFAHHDFNNSSSYALAHTNQGNTQINAHTGKDIFFRINNQNKMVVRDSGNVGIGTTTPDQKLHS